MVDLGKEGFYPLRSIDFDHIEAGLQFAAGFQEPELRRGNHAALFRIGNKFAGLSEIGVFPLLDFHEGDNFTFLGNNVDLSLAASEIALQHFIPVQTQISGGSVVATGDTLLVI